MSIVVGVSVGGGVKVEDGGIGVEVAGGHYISTRCYLWNCVSQV